jgi:hypothetical protein
MLSISISLHGGQKIDFVFYRSSLLLYEGSTYNRIVNVAGPKAMREYMKIPIDPAYAGI